MSLFRNLGDGSFREMAAEAGVDNLLDGRGIGVGDFDSDGRVDQYLTRREQARMREARGGGGGAAAPARAKAS